MRENEGSGHSMMNSLTALTVSHGLQKHGPDQAPLSADKWPWQERQEDWGSALPRHISLVGFVFEVKEGEKIFDFGIKGNCWRAQTQDYQAEIR